MNSVYDSREEFASGQRVVSGVQGALRSVREAYRRAIRERGLEPEQLELLTLLIDGPKRPPEIFELLALTSDDPAALLQQSIGKRHIKFDAQGRLRIARDGMRLLATLTPTLDEMNRRWRERLAQAFPEMRLDLFFGMLRTASRANSSIPPPDDGHPIGDENENSSKGETR